MAHTDIESPHRKPGMERLGIVLGIIAVLAISVASFWGAAFFFIPLGLVALATWIFVALLRKVPFRNRYVNERPTLSDRYADGQPYRRSWEHERDLPYKEADESPPRMRDDERGTHAP